MPEPVVETTTEVYYPNRRPWVNQRSERLRSKMLGLAPPMFHPRELINPIFEPEHKRLLRQARMAMSILPART
ncbi:hypothetical protein M5689_021326 [Euphorbia peplus]|nr:hypothetical protein M5689_021326 [Euphorbia peplus]